MERARRQAAIATPSLRAHASDPKRMELAVLGADHDVGITVAVDLVVVGRRHSGNEAELVARILAAIRSAFASR